MSTSRSTLGALLVVAALAAASSNPSRAGAAQAQGTVVDSIASPAGPGSAEPFLATDATGTVYLSWLEPVDSGFALRFSSLAGSTWSAPRTITSGRNMMANWADFPSILAMGNGQLSAHWLEREGRGAYAYGVRVTRSDDGGRSWSAPVIPYRDTSRTEHGFVAMWAEGTTLGLVWLDGRNFAGTNPTREMMLLSTTISPTGVRGPETRLDERTCDCCQNAAAVAAGGPVVVYRDRSADEIRDIYVTRRVNGTWTPGVPVHRDSWKINACPVNGPAIAAVGNRVAVAWFTAADDRPMVKVAFSTNGGETFAAPIRIDGGNPAGRVDIALLEDGSALVTWIERAGGDAAEVRARRVRAGGNAGTPVTIATSSAARASGFPRMVVSRSDIVFAWTVPGRPSAIRVARSPIARF